MEQAYYGTGIPSEAHLRMRRKLAHQASLEDLEVMEEMPCPVTLNLRGIKDYEIKSLHYFLELGRMPRSPSLGDIWEPFRYAKQQGKQTDP